MSSTSRKEDKRAQRLGNKGFQQTSAMRPTWAVTASDCSHPVPDNHPGKQQDVDQQINPRADSVTYVNPVFINPDVDMELTSLQH